MRHFLFLFLLITLSSCHVSSQMAMNGSGGRNSYNTAIQMTNSQQMLLNLVRLRYVDVPLFLEVSGVTTQFTYKSNLSAAASVPGFDQENPFVLGGEFSWQNQPTISYTPLEGKAFTSRLLRPIQLSTIQQLIYSGWEIDRIFMIMLQNFDDLYNAPEISGPFPERIPKLKLFAEAIEILHNFQLKGELQVGIHVQKGKEEDEQIMQIMVPDEGAEAQRLYELLPHAKKRDQKILLSMELGFNDRGKLGIMPRNILSSMYYLSQGVCVPHDHYLCGLIPEYEEEASEQLKENICPLFSVKCSFMPPRDAFVAVSYRNHWYYIEDCDLTSKKTFALLIQLYNLHAEESRPVGPILTLPLK